MHRVYRCGRSGLWGVVNDDTDTILPAIHFTPQEALQSIILPGGGEEVPEGNSI